MSRIRTPVVWRLLVSLLPRRCHWLERVRQHRVGTGSRSAEAIRVRGDGARAERDAGGGGSVKFWLSLLGPEGGRIFPALGFGLTLPTLVAVFGCAVNTAMPTWVVSEEGLNVVRLEAQAASASQNTHPASLSPRDVATILRGVRTWERRNLIHRLVSGEAAKTRAFRDDEIAFLAPALSKGLAQASPAERVFFHLSHATEAGEEETTTGWLYIRDPIFHLVLTGVHDRHGPGPDISKYDRRMPDIPEAPGTFTVTFEPEEYLQKVISGSGWMRVGQQEELQIRYREALPILPLHPLRGKE